MGKTPWGQILITYTILLPILRVQRATVLSVQVSGDSECSFGARRGSLLAQLGPHGWPE